MFTFGDILAVLGIFVGVALTSWATLLAFGLLFEEKCSRAALAIERKPWTMAMLGSAFVLVVGFFGVALLSAGPVPAKLLGWVVLGWILTVGLVGGAGMVESVSARIAALSADVRPFTARSRAAAILVGAGLLPLAGWFVFAPALLVMSVGAGCFALFAKQRQIAVENLG